jgi:hypothetical protein
MRYFITLAFLLGIFAIGFRFGEQPFQVTSTVKQGEANIGFDWSFGALIGKNKTLVSISHDTTLKSGEEIKMMVKLTKECYVYIVHFGSKGEVKLLFPYSTSQFQKDYVEDKNYYVLPGRDWSILDKNTGKEVFFLLASTERLIDLEAKINTYLSVADSAKKQTLASDIVTEIRSVRKHYSIFSTIAEKPVTIGGNIRGMEEVKESLRPDVANIAIHVSANNFYSKTITIDHQ